MRSKLDFNAVADFIAADALETGRSRRRILYGIAGGPGVGKSTLAEAVVGRLSRDNPARAALVPMDGFHMRQAALEAAGTAGAKGAPHTFKPAGFADFLARLKTASATVSGPGYSRKIEDVVDDSVVIPGTAAILIVEGNYLLLSVPPWDRVKPLLDRCIFVSVPREVVKQRLLKRHAAEGLFSAERNQWHVENIDLANYDLVATTEERADLSVEIADA